MAKLSCVFYLQYIFMSPDKRHFDSTLTKWTFNKVIKHNYHFWVVLVVFPKSQLDVVKSWWLPMLSPFGTSPLDGFIVCLQMFHSSGSLWMSWLDASNQEPSGTLFIFPKDTSITSPQCKNIGLLSFYLAFTLGCASFRTITLGQQKNKKQKQKHCPLEWTF